MGAVVVVDQPFVQQVLQLGDAEAGLGFGIRSAAGDVGAGVAGQVLAQQGVDGAEGALDDAFGGGSVGRGGLDADAESFAGSAERRGQVDLVPVHDDRLGHHDRPGSGALKAFVQAH